MWRERRIQGLQRNATSGLAWNHGPNGKRITLSPTSQVRFENCTGNTVVSGASEECDLEL